MRYELCGAPAGFSYQLTSTKREAIFRDYPPLLHTNPIHSSRISQKLQFRKKVEMFPTWCRRKSSKQSNVTVWLTYQLCFASRDYTTGARKVWVSFLHKSDTGIINQPPQSTQFKQTIGNDRSCNFFARLSSNLNAWPKFEWWLVTGWRRDCRHTKTPKNLNLFLWGHGSQLSI